MSRALPLVVSVAFGLGVITLPAPLEVATFEYAGFFALHDRLHPPEKVKGESSELMVRKTFWDDHDRVLLVDARTSQGKGALMIVEGLSGSDWLSAFRITADDGAVFDLIVPEGESVPCEVLVRSGSAIAVTPVENAPQACAATEDPAGTLTRT